MPEGVAGLSRPAPKSFASRCIVGLALVLAALTLPLYGTKVWLKTDYSDFLVYHRTSERMQAANWGDVYNLEKDGNSPFRYAPPTLPFFRPWGFMPYEPARLAWFFFQALCFGFGFQSLRRSLRKVDPARADVLTAMAFLFSLRFCLDSFMIGQVTGTMFLLIAWALEAYFAGRIGRMGAALFFPAALKVGPGILFGLLLREPRKLTRAALASLSVGAALLIPLFAEVRDWSVVTGFVTEWWGLLLSDSSFFDSSHYGSQALKSALQRAAARGYLPDAWVSALHLGSAFLGCIGLAWLWFTRIPRTPRGQGLFFGLGMLAYLLFMPFTFKYSIPLIAFPVAFLLAGPLRMIDKIIFGASCALLPLAGPIFTGETLFFFLQKASFPFFAIAALSVCCATHAWKESSKS